jgi:hypothetical protein
VITLTEANVQQLKNDYDPNLIDALLTHAQDIDLSSAYNVALSVLVNRMPYNSPYDTLAIQRRRYETQLLEQEVGMFQELRNLLASISAQYSAITGTSSSSTTGG